MITYPVPENSRWAIYDTAQDAVVARNKPWPRADGMAIAGAPQTVVPLLHVATAQPSYDAATHKLQATAEVVDVVANTLTTNWQVVALSAAELATIADQSETNAATVAAKAAYQDLIAGTGTTAQRLTRCERVLARILRHTFGE